MEIQVGHMGRHWPSKLARWWKFRRVGVVGRVAVGGVCVSPALDICIMASLLDPLCGPSLLSLHIVIDLIV